MSRTVKFEIVVTIDESINSGKIAVECDESPIPLDALSIMTANLIQAVALQSKAGYEEALQLLVDGARKSRVAMSHGVKVQ